MIPQAGSAYAYSYATLGELVAWIIGWDLILEYAVSNMAVCVGFAAHIVDFMDWFGVHPTARWISPAFLPSGLSDLQGNTIYQPGWHFGDLAEGILPNDERWMANTRCDQIAEDMWQQYQQHLAMGHWDDETDSH